MYLRFGDHHLFQPPIPFIFRDDGFQGRLQKDAEESIDVKKIRIHEPWPSLKRMRSEFMANGVGHYASRADHIHKVIFVKR